LEEELQDLTIDKHLIDNKINDTQLICSKHEMFQDFNAKSLKACFGSKEQANSSPTPLALPNPWSNLGKEKLTTHHTFEEQKNFDVLGTNGTNLNKPIKELPRESRPKSQIGEEFTIFSPIVASTIHEPQGDINEFQFASINCSQNIVPKVTPCSCLEITSTSPISFNFSKTFESTCFATKHNNEETTNYLIEELFLASLETKDETEKLIREVTNVHYRLEDCKLTPLDFQNFITQCSTQHEEVTMVNSNTFGHDEVIILKEDRKKMAERLSKQVQISRDYNIVVPFENNELEPSTLVTRVPCQQLKKCNEPTCSIKGVLNKNLLVEDISNVLCDFCASFIIVNEKMDMKKLENQMDEINKHNAKGEEANQIMMVPIEVIKANWRTNCQKEGKFPSKNMHVMPLNPTYNIASIEILANQQANFFVEHQKLFKHVLCSSSSIDIHSVDHIRENSNNLLVQKKPFSHEMVGPHNPMPYVYLQDVLKNKQITSFIIVHNSITKKLLEDSQPLGSIKVNHGVHNGKENCNKENIYCGMLGSDEEMNILASLERLDGKLATINKRKLNIGRNSVMSQGQSSTMSAWSAPTVMVCEVDHFNTIQQANLHRSRPKKNVYNLPRTIVSSIFYPLHT
jgi:hypothetical protein